jgi:hypothetical protein
MPRRPVAPVNFCPRPGKNLPPRLRFLSKQAALVFLPAPGGRLFKSPEFVVEFQNGATFNPQIPTTIPWPEGNRGYERPARRVGIMIVIGPQGGKESRGTANIRGKGCESRCLV